MGFRIIKAALTGVEQGERKHFSVPHLSVCKMVLRNESDIKEHPTERKQRNHHTRNISHLLETLEASFHLTRFFV
mgnify:CR=1 FL=1